MKWLRLRAWPAACVALALLSACDEAEYPTSGAVTPRVGMDFARLVPQRPIPTNGALPLGVFPIAPTVIVWVNNYEAKTEGEVRNVAGYWAWVPSKPLEQGTLIVSLTFSPDGVIRNEVSYPIEVVGPYARRAPGLVSEPSASLHSTPLQRRCCGAWNGAELVESFCATTSYQDRVLLGPGLISADADIALRQHAFAVYRALPEERQLVGVGLWQEWPEIIFEDQADDYCFEIEATDFTTGRLYQYRGLTPRCAEHGDLPDLERHDTDLTDDALDHFTCEVPPHGYEERWCALNDDDCQKSPESAGCGLDDYVCHGGELPEATGGAAGFAAIGPNGTGLDPNAPPQVIVTGSEPAECSAASGALRARPVLIAMFALVALALVRRRLR